MADVVRARTSDLTWRDVEGHVVLLDLRSSQFHEFNRTGSVLWSMLADAPDGLAVAALGNHVSQLYGIDQLTAEHDVDAFVSRLAELDLLEG